VERDELERRGDRDPGVRNETVELAPDGFGGGRDLLGIRDVERSASASPSVRTPP
jgi:hypothetical protein